MFIEIIANRRDASLRLALIKVETKRFGTPTIPAYFDRKLPLPPIGMMEVMIEGVLSHKYDNGYFNLDEVPKCFFIRPIGDETKVKLKGFETWGSACCTTSSAVNVNDRKDTYAEVTPGKLMSHIVDIHNDSRAFYGKDPLPLIGGVAYIELVKLTNKYRLRGLDDPSMLTFTRSFEEMGYDDEGNA